MAALMMEQMAEDPRLRLKKPSIRVEGGKQGVRRRTRYLIARPVACAASLFVRTRWASRHAFACGTQTRRCAQDTIYMRGFLEEDYVQNLDQPVSSFFDSGAELIVTDPGVPTPLKVIVNFTDDVVVAD